MKALSLWQPYATLVAVGAKRIETRSWATAHRGLLAIHATKAFPAEARDLCFTEPFKAALRPLIGRHGALVGGDELALPRGAIVAVARLADCKSMAVARSTRYLPAWWPAEGTPERAFGDYEGPRFAWLLDDIRPLPEPIPCRGAQGLWTVPADVLALVERQVPSAANPSRPTTPPDEPGGDR